MQGPTVNCTVNLSIEVTKGLLQGHTWRIYRAYLGTCRVWVWVLGFWT